MDEKKKKKKTFSMKTRNSAPPRSITPGEKNYLIASCYDPEQPNGGLERATEFCTRQFGYKLNERSWRRWTAKAKRNSPQRSVGRIPCIDGERIQEMKAQLFERTDKNNPVRSNVEAKHVFNTAVRKTRTGHNRAGHGTFLSKSSYYIYKKKIMKERLAHSTPASRLRQACDVRNFMAFAALGNAIWTNVDYPGSISNLDFTGLKFGEDNKKMCLVPIEFPWEKQVAYHKNQSGLQQVFKIGTHTFGDGGFSGAVVWMKKPLHPEKHTDLMFVLKVPQGSFPKCPSYLVITDPSLPDEKFFAWYFQHVLDCIIEKRYVHSNIVRNH
jgi:hypothetical protein